MKLFLCGGGDGNKTIEANKRFNEVIDHSKPILYIPLAMDENRHLYDSCYEWITNELKLVDVPTIDMVRSKEELSLKNLEDYSAIFIGGGNTFKLLNDLKTSESFEKIKSYLENDGIVFGESAGAIIFGQSLDSCKYDDDNIVDLKDIRGFDLVSYYSILCHYTNRSSEHDERSKEYLKQLSKEEAVIALPEEVTIFINNGEYEIIGNRPFYIFSEGNVIEYNNSNNRLEEYLSLTNENELMDFMNKNITYGWVDINNKQHFNNLTNFRKNYVVSSIEKTFETGLGTCIEQASIIKKFFDRIGFENKLYCHRSYENELNINNDIRMHCFVLFKKDEKWYHFEHSNRQKRGIHEYATEEEAIFDITKGFKEHGDIRKLTQIDEIPEGLTFLEFNEYVNEFDYKKVK